MAAVGRRRRPPGRLRSTGVPWRAGLLAIGAGALLSLSMETAQACFSGRVSSAWDVLANTLGTALGWFVGLGRFLLPPAFLALGIALIRRNESEHRLRIGVGSARVPYSVP